MRLHRVSWHLTRDISDAQEAVLKLWGGTKSFSVGIAEVVQTQANMDPLTGCPTGAH